MGRRKFPDLALDYASENYILLFLFSCAEIGWQVIYLPLKVPIVQWIELWFPVPPMGVRIPLGTPKKLFLNRFKIKKEAQWLPFLLELKTELNFFDQ